MFALPISLLSPSTGCRPVVLGIPRGIAALSPSYRVLPALLSPSSWVAPALSPSFWVSPLHPGYWLSPSTHRRLVEFHHTQPWFSGVFWWSGMMTNWKGSGRELGEGCSPSWSLCYEFNVYWYRILTLKPVIDWCYPRPTPVSPNRNLPAFRGALLLLILVSSNARAGCAVVVASPVTTLPFITLVVLCRGWRIIWYKWKHVWYTHLRRFEWSS
jgi:hypothetical protein